MRKTKQVDIIGVFQNTFEEDVLKISLAEHDEIELSKEAEYDVLQIYNVPNFLTFKTPLTEVERIGFNHSAIIDIKELMLLSDIDDTVLKDIDFSRLENLDYKTSTRISTIE